jgi:hypothetical protein
MIEAFITAYPNHRDPAIGELLANIFSLLFIESGLHAMGMRGAKFHAKHTCFRAILQQSG